jgi:multidrug efflux pump subunit AcrA (membrane-fusion protein)
MKFLISQKEKPPRRAAIVAKRFVKSKAVKYGTVISPVTAPGRVVSVSEVDLIAEASGKIITGKIPLKKGAEFSKGDRLFTIYTDEAVLALKARKSQFLNTLANLLPDIAYDFSSEEEIYRKFFSSIKIEGDLPPFPEIRHEKLRIFLASRNILSEYYNIRKDELKLSRHTVKAPFKGTYTQVNLESGAYANTGGKVAHAIRTDELELEIPLERFDAEWVRIGDEVTIYSDKRSKKWEGVVLRKGRFVDANTQSQSIFVKVKSQGDASLLAGEYLTAKFAGHSIKNVMEIPRNVVFNTNEVFIIVKGRLQKRIINIVKVNEKTLLFNGLSEGDVLVMQPLINVHEGTLVETRGEKKTKSAKDFRDYPVKPAEKNDP